MSTMALVIIVIITCLKMPTFDAVVAGFHVDDEARKTGSDVAVSDLKDSDVALSATGTGSVEQRKDICGTSEDTRIIPRHGSLCVHILRCDASSYPHPSIGGAGHQYDLRIGASRLKGFPKTD